MAIPMRPMTAEAVDTLHRLAHSRTEPARVVERARMIWLAHQGQQGPAMGRELRRCPATVRCWRQRCNGQGLAGVQAAPRPGRPVSSTSEPGSEVIATRLTKPQELGLPFARWPLARLATYRQEGTGLPRKRSRMDERWLREGWRWRTQEPGFGARVAPACAVTRGSSRRARPRRRRAGSSCAWMSWGPPAPRAFQGKSWGRSSSPRLPQRGRPMPPRRPLARRLAP